MVPRIKFASSICTLSLSKQFVVILLICNVIYISIMNITARGRKKITILNQIFSFTRFQHAKLLFFYQAHLNTIQLQSKFVHLVLRMHPSCVFYFYLLMCSLFCITRTNLIRAEGIQISVHTPNTIWSPNKGLEERKERITNLFSRVRKRIAAGM